MNITDKLPALPKLSNSPTHSGDSIPAPVGADGFGSTLKKFMSDVNAMQVKADMKTQQFATGEIQDLHEVMAAAEEASISMMLLLEIRNKALEGYKELMRTPV